MVGGTGGDIGEGTGGAMVGGTGGATSQSLTCGTADEGKPLTLQCPPGMVIEQITFASYGTPTGSCETAERGECHAFASEREVENRCLDRNRCEVPATSRAFYDACPGTAKELSAAATCSAPKLRPFYRNQPVLGPFLQTGQGLVEPPSYLDESDFPYQRRGSTEEVPFADHLSVVRLLGGIGSKANPSRDLDLATRNAQGVLEFHQELLEAKLQRYINAGYTPQDMTLVLDNIPWDLTPEPEDGTYGNEGVPGLEGGTHDPSEWFWFVERLAQGLKTIFGEEPANFFRFRVGTEYRFAGTEDQYLTHYDYAAAAVHDVLPGAQIGPANAAAVAMSALESGRIAAFEVAEHMLGPNRATGKFDRRFDFFSASRYLRFGTDVESGVRLFIEGCAELAKRYPELSHVPCEVHEWGRATTRGGGYWPTDEPGAWGTAQLLHQLIRYYEAGMRVWHWDVADRYRSGGALRRLFIGLAMPLSVLDAMVGGEPWTADAASYPSEQGVKYVGIGSRLANRSIFLIAASDSEEREKDITETVSFRFPAHYVAGRSNLSFVALTRKTSAHQGVHADLMAEGMLLDTNGDAYASRPERLSSIRDMLANASAESDIVGPNRTKYESLYNSALTAKPAAQAHLSIDGDEATLEISLNAPSVTAVIFEP